MLSKKCVSVNSRHTEKEIFEWKEYFYLKV
jgi:hypothetical protein